MNSSRGFQAEVNSKFEPLFIKKVCEPILARTPESLHPNTISMITHVFCWVTASLAFAAWQLAPLGRTLALLGAGASMFVAVVGDCLDGMQARRTNRCSKLGEMMDHWLDAVGVPLTTVGITMALQLPLWALAPVHIATAMVYNAQLVLYHHTGRFVHPSTSGTDCQLGTSIGYVTMGVVFLLFDRNAYWLDKTVAGIGVVAMVVQARILWFYYVRMKWLVLHHLPSVLLCAGFAVLYLTSIIDVGAFLLSIVLISFRMNGSYVLFTIIQQRFHGFDLGIALWATVIAAAHFFVEPFKVGGYDVHLYLPYLACLYMLTRNLIDFVRHFPELKPAELERSVRTA